MFQCLYYVSVFTVTNNPTFLHCFSLLKSKRICFCSLGFPSKLQSQRGKNQFLGEISRLEDFLKDPWLFRVKDGATVQIPVPKLAPPPPPPPVIHPDDAAATAAADELLSAQTKRAALQKKAAVASLAAEDFARRFESGALVVEAPKEAAVEEQLQPNPNVNVMCRLCFSGENQGTERAKKMLPCRTCGKKYHKNCLKTWSHHRDLFHWSSWACPSCRICEVCRRAGEPNKFKFCKRCDGAFHCYCMQPPHKNVSSGPYLCPKHTKCHSCESNVPGNGLSVRWFLGYTCCDACGRLFTKGNYCPVCLKVYRDSEATPMVCCDVCQRWVHIQCDGISDDRYLQFQMDGNLPYTCPTCRGECYQVRDLDDAVHELWRRRDEADRELIVSLRAAAGLPTQEEIFSISPFSDDDDDGPGAGRSAKFSYRSVADFSPKKVKESNKKPSSRKYAKKKRYQASLDEMENKHEIHHEPQSYEFLSGVGKDVLHSDGAELPSSPFTENYSSPDRKFAAKEPGVLKRKYVDEVIGTNIDRRATVLPIKKKKISDTAINEESGKVVNKPKTMKGTKLVIHLGGRNKTITNSPRSDSSSHQRDELMSLSGNEAVSQRRMGDLIVERVDGNAFSDDGYRVDAPNEIEGSKPRERNIIKLGKGKIGTPDSNLKSERGNGFLSPQPTLILSSRRHEGRPVEGLQNSVSESENARLKMHPQPTLISDMPGDMSKSIKPVPSSVDASLKDSRPLIRLKVKSPYPGSWAPNGEEERGSVKGQRSKRKRPSLEKSARQEEEDVTASQDEIMDACWILKKLGRDAIGKRVEVHQLSDNSWHKGVVSDVVEGTSMLSVDLDDGRAKTMELGKQGIRFVPQKQKRLKP